MRKAFLVLASAALFMAGCSDGSSSSRRAEGPAGPAQTTEVKVEIVHASQDAPPVNLSVGGAVVAASADFGDAAFTTAPEGGDFLIEVEGIIPGGNAMVISETATIADGQRVTVFAANDVLNIEPIILIDGQAPVAADEVRVRVVHAASNVTPIAAMVDIYVSAPTDLLADVTPITLMFGGSSPALTVPEGDYRIRVTPAADPSTVVFDSGTVPLTGGSDLVVAAITNLGPGAAPIELIATTGNTSLRIIDANTPADLRVGHISAVIFSKPEYQTSS